MTDRRTDGATDEQMDGPTDGPTLLQRCPDTSEKIMVFLGLSIKLSFWNENISFSWNEAVKKIPDGSDILKLHAKEAVMKVTHLCNYSEPEQMVCGYFQENKWSRVIVSLTRKGEGWLGLNCTSQLNHFAQTDKPLNWSNNKPMDQQDDGLTHQRTDINTNRHKTCTQIIATNF